MASTRATGIDKGILIAVILLMVIGLAAIYSASHLVDGTSKCFKQFIWILAGSVGMFFIIRADYRPWQRYWRLLLFTTIIALLATLLFARSINGARSWLDLGAFRLQPSEFTKLTLILMLAGVLARYHEKIAQPSFLLRTLGYLVVPILLVLMQPDFGTAMVLSTIWVVMVVVAEARWWMITTIILGATILLLGAWFIPLPNGKTLIKDYQKRRIDFIHADPAGNGYHQRQARIAIGAGELWGRGYLKGTQTRSGFLPEQDTDFIFAVIGEEFGFAGLLLVLGIYLYLLSRIINAIEEAESRFSQYTIAGVAAMLFVHVLVNVGMCLSLLPVTGVPLPFISYGGSSMLTNLFGIGIILNMSRHRLVKRNWVKQEELLRIPDIQ